MVDSKVVVITGSSNGIGKALAKLFLKKEYAVVINGRKLDRLKVTAAELEQYGKVHPIAGDISQKDQAKRLIDETIAYFGRLDILINNAGIALKAPLQETDPDVFKQVYYTNVFGTINTSSPAIPHLTEAGGSLVFISSVAGIRGLPEFSAYASSKMALRGIADSVKLELNDKGVHVGLIYVGFTENDKEKKTLNASGELQPINNNSGFKLQTPDQVAQAIFYNIDKRRYISVLSSLGKLNMLMNRFFPKLTEVIIKRQLKNR